MNELARLSNIVFTGDSYDLLSAEHEVELIRGVQAGDTDAYIALAKSYSRALRGFLKGFNSTDALTLEEARETLLTVFSECVMAYDLTDTSKRLSYFIKHPCKRALASTRDEQAMPVDIPYAQLKRMRKLNREHAGDLRQMEAHASEANLSVKTLRDILAWKYPVSFDPKIHDAPEEESEDMNPDYSEYADIALASIADDPTASLVVHYKYWFDSPSDGYNAEHTRSNAAVSDLMHINTSKVSRTHAAALETMRQALGIGTPQEEAA